MVTIHTFFRLPSFALSGFWELLLQPFRGLTPPGYVLFRPFGPNKGKESPDFTSGANKEKNQ